MVPLLIQPEAGTKRRSAVRLPLMMAGGLSIAALVVMAALCFSPVPLALGSLIVVGPASHTEVLFYNGQLSVGAPPGKYEVGFKSNSGVATQRFWVDRFYVWFPFVVLVR